MLTRQRMEELKEDPLTKEVLIPLLRAMGYQDVEFHGGRGEYGKDIVGWKQDDLGLRRNLAVVVKAVPITGKASSSKGSAGEVQTQIQQAFGRRFSDPRTGEEQRIHECWVVTSWTISREAREAIVSALAASNLDRNVRFVDGPALWRYVQQYLPLRSIWQQLEEASTVLGELDSHYVPHLNITQYGIEVNLVEKFPGASLEKPLVIKGEFEFPNTPEGRAAREALERHISTGAPVEIPSQFIRSMQLPEIWKQLEGENDGEKGVLQLGPARSDFRLLSSLTLDCDDGMNISLPYIDLSVTQAGRDEITLTNESQPIPIHVTLLLRPKAQLATVSFRPRDTAMNINQFVQWQRLRQAMSQAGVARLIHLDTGFLLFEMPFAGDPAQAPDETLVEAMRDLLAIQLKLKRPIEIPKRQFTPEEADTIGILRTILHEGRLITKGGCPTLALLPEGVRQTLETFGNGSVGFLRTETEETETLFGTELPVGRVRTTCRHVVLVNEDEVRNRLAMVTSDDEPIECKFGLADEGHIVVEYLDWLPADLCDSNTLLTAED